MPEQYYDISYTGEQVNEAIGRMLSGEVEAAVEQVNQRAEEVETAVGEAQRAGESAVEAAEQIQNMTVEAETIPSTQSALVEKTISEDGVVNLKLFIPKGQQGEIGPQGTPGVDGKSPYQAAVEAGYTGTEAEFYAALVSLQNAPFVPVSGGEVNGPLSINYYGGLRIGAGFPDNAYQEVVGYTCNADGRFPFIVLSQLDPNGNTTGNKIMIEGVETPEWGSDDYVANKKYVDDRVGNIGEVLDAINGEVV